MDFAEEGLQRDVAIGGSAGQGFLLSFSQGVHGPCI